ncbi:MFS transporter, UMF1 family [Lishizhenia tianjinensis]|uniref:MFS transporter, UMF1 family n=1 Tax=Lishizhenia tianjinensis TaxID=477690 RepID=A0A1I7AGP5_9FLAO|nr:MFS transporter, UMF1 family [Lishizhenia tianjinensis]
MERFPERDELLPGEKVMVDFFGMDVENQLLITYILSFSFLVVSVLSPLLSGIADVVGSKKRFLQFFCYLGSFACMGLYFFNQNISLGMISIFLASIGFWNSLVFYNAYLPEIAEPKDHDKISARGFSMGYFGAMILLILSLYMIMSSDETNGLYNVSIASWWRVEYSFIGVGIWWLGFSQITFKALPLNVYNRKKEKGYIWKGFQELKVVFQEFRKTKRLKRFLMSFFFFNTGVQTVMLMAVYFAKEEIEWGPGGGDTGLIVSILLIQILAAVGAFVMSRASGLLGNINTLKIVVALWFVLCVVAYFITTPVEFYLLAAGVGLVMGGVQALARSTYSKFLPETKDHASYFSFYDSTEKIGIVLGTFFWGLVYGITGDLRDSVISITIFFALGMIFLFFVPQKEKEA